MRQEDASSTKTATLSFPGGSVLIQERRSVPRDEPIRVAEAPSSYNASAQMSALGGLIILGVLAGSYTTKYDLAIGHLDGALAVPAVGFLALQLFLARAAYRLFHDVRQANSFGAYLQHRLLRYLPALLPAVFIGFVVIQFGDVPRLHVSAGALPANLAMLADIIGAETIDASHWRLKIEIMLSVLVGLAWFSQARRHLAPLLLGALVVSAIYLDGEPARQHTLTLHGLVTADGYLPLFSFGIALFQLTAEPRARSWWLVLAASLYLAFLSNEPLHGAVVVASLAALAAIATGRLAFLGKVRCLVHLGDIAFPIYVVHFVTGFAVIHGLEKAGAPALLAIAAASLLAIGLGKALNVLFELPIQKHAPALIMILDRSIRTRIFTGMTEASEIVCGDGMAESARA